MARIDNYTLMVQQTGTNRNDLEVGMQVEINPQRDRTRRQRFSGVIKEILTNSSHHTHGILVSLESGEIGRVKKIISLPSETVIKAKPQQELPSAVPLTKGLESLIDEGENHFVEFKSSILWSIKFTDEDIQKSRSWEVKKYGKNTSKFIIAKTLSGFLNTDGGNLIVGVKENKTKAEDEIIGVESEFFKLQDPCVDGYRRMILDQIVKPFLPVKYFHHFNDYLTIAFEIINGKTVCWIQVQKGDEQAFLTHNKQEHFFVRIDASTRELHGEDIVNYCLKRFS